jgi:DNA ligase D
MLAKLHESAFDDKGWIFEIKWDGYRAIAEVNGDKSRLYSRNGLAFEDEYAVVFQELQKIKHKALLDGEIVAFNDKGMPSFQALQQYQPETTVLHYYVFDLLSLEGKSTKDLPLLERKALLKKLLPKSDVIKYCDHVEADGVAFFKAMQKQGLEGMIAKKADSVYTEDSRGSNWLKVKHMLTDEAVIAGFTEPRGSRKFFGALILGAYKRGKLEYIGHTGTGFTQKSIKEMHELLKPLITDTNPFPGKVRVNAPVTWVKPQLVCNLKYTEKTAEGSRRHPVFMGLRVDKAAKEVKPEAPIAKEKTEPVMQKKTAAKKVAVKKAAAKKAVTKTPTKTTAKKAAPKKAAAKRTPAKKNAVEKTVGGKKLILTNADKIYWPKEGYTKGDVIDYYNTIYPHIIKYLKGRPQSLKRTPNGITGEAFYHKDAGENAPEWLDTYPTYSDSAGKTIDYLIINDKPSLLYVANLGCIEINPWNSTIHNPDNPDYAVIDLDPSDKNSFEQVIDCAQVVKEILDSAGCKSYCKTSGSTGLHIYIPLGGKYDYEQARQFSQIVAQLAQDQLPEFTTLERSLSKRPKSHIYIDYLQNKKGQTLSSVYSLRPKPGAPVSTPLEWKEVKHGLNMFDFNIENIQKRIQKKGDLFAPILGRGIDILKIINKLSA